MATDMATTNGFTLTPQTLQEAQDYAKLIASSDFVPNEFKGKPANVMIACQMGAELGLKPLQSLQNIAVINGKPTVWGDALVAIVRSRKDCEYVRESFNDQTMTASCAVKRRGQPEEVRTFSQADAQTAKLWGKSGPWQNYPKRMLQMRARAFALRDVFGDALKGFQVAEEVMDYQEARDITGEATMTAPEPAALPEYPSDQFATNFPKWEAAIRGGKKTAADIISTVSSKYTLTSEQIKQVEAVKADVTDAEVVEDEKA